MKHYLRFLITMLLLAIWGGISYGQTWQKVALSELTSDDVFVIAEVHSSTTYAMANDNGASLPKAIKIITSKDGKTIDGTVADNLKWTIAKEGDAYVFYPNGNTKNWLYCTDDSKGLKVGTNKTNKTFVLYENTTYNYSGLKNVKVDRCVVNYSGKDWRSYQSGPNIKNQQLAYYKYVKDTRTSTNVTFGADDDKTFDVNEGEGASFVGKIAVEKDNVAGSIKYTSDKPEIVAVNGSTGVLTFGKSFGKATITALFTPEDAATYAESSASYIIIYKEKTRIVTTLAFAETEGAVNLGETFTLPVLTLKAGDEILTGKTYKYTSSAPEVASIDENTGEVKILSAGNTVLKAEFTDADDVYKSSSAEFTLKVIDPNTPNTIVFSVADGSFKNVGGYSGAKDVVFVSASGDNYTFNLTQCMKATTKNYLGWLQMSSGDSDRGNGIVKSPSFNSFPNGYKVTVYYTVGSKPKNLTITSEELPNATSTTMINGDDYVTTISLPLSTAKFIMTANAAPKYVSKIELTPLAGPATVTLDETSDDISTVISENNGKTVNVTLKRTISKDYLNPVCLPFDLSAEKIAEVFGVGSVVSDYTSVEGTVMNFTPVTTMTANHPYIVQATESFGTKNIAGVTLKTIAEETIAEGEKENIVTFENSNSTFLGSFVGSPSIVVFSKDVEMKLFLGKDGNLYHPTSGSKMKGMRAYFDVTDLTSSEAKVNIGGSLSSIGKLMNGEAITGKVYNLNGQYVGNTLDGLAKGLYIINGKKYIVK